MPSVCLIKDTFVVKDRGAYIVYSPSGGKITRVSEFPGENTEVFISLSKMGFFNNPSNVVSRDTVDSWRGFRSLTLLLTRRCNLKCTYCYAAAKDYGRTISLSFAVKALDWFEKQLDGKTLRISFHGGGEPTLEMGIIKEVVTRACFLSEKNDKRTRFQIVTNGTFNMNVADWLIENNFGISISADGPPYIQNRNRPFTDGSESSGVVEKNIVYLIGRRYPFTVRLTFSPVDDIEKVVRYFGELGVKSLHLEPLFPYGRDYKQVVFGENNREIYSPSGKEFVGAFLIAMDTAKKCGIKITNSHLGHLTKWSGYFCGSACGRSMIVTDDEFISGCLEVVDSHDPNFETFQLGSFSHIRNEFVADKKVLVQFQNRHSDNLSCCKKCFARYVCSGGCAVKAVRASGNFMDKDVPYCEFTKVLIPAVIKRIACLSGI